MTTATEPGTRTATTYIVLQKVGRTITRDDSETPVAEDAWQLRGTDVTAPNAEAAIRQIIDEGSGTGVYVAVPTRSWKPVTAKAETRTVITLDGD